MRGARCYPSVYEYPTGLTEECIRIDLPGGGREFHFPGGGMTGSYPLTQHQRDSLTINADSLRWTQRTWWQRLLFWRSEE